MRPEAWRAVCDLAERQHGLVSTHQLATLGVSDDALAWAARTNRLAAVRQGAWAIAGAPASVWRELRATLLVVDGVASHRAAAGLHRLPGIAPGAVELTVFDMSTPRLQGAIVHRASVVVADDIVEIEGIATTTTARTIVDLAGAHTIETSLLARMIDDCAMRRLCSPADVAACLDRCEARRGRRRLRALLDDRLSADSQLEARWLRRLQRAGLRPPAVGYQLVVANRVIVLDFAWPEHRVGIEVDGWQPHATRSAFDRDRLRDLAARRVGWTILRVTSRTPAAELFATLRPLISQSSAS